MAIYLVIFEIIDSMIKFSDEETIGEAFSEELKCSKFLNQLEAISPPQRILANSFFIESLKHADEIMADILSKFNELKSKIEEQNEIELKIFINEVVIDSSIYNNFSYEVIAFIKNRVRQH